MPESDEATSWIGLVPSKGGCSCADEATVNVMEIAVGMPCCEGHRELARLLYREVNRRICGGIFIMPPDGFFALERDVINRDRRETLGLGPDMSGWVLF